MTTSHRLPVGTLLGGRYRLLEPLPGAGRSWHARDEVDRRDLVARVVVLPAAMPAAERDLARQRALHDAAAVSRVHHRAIAPVVDAVVEDGTPWVISVRPAGRSLGDVVRAGGPLPAEVVALVGLQVLDALVAAGVPHGDLTPDDVLVGTGGRVTVTGFATTRVDGTETPGFRAPEGGPSAAADLWALGVTLYAAAEGRLPDGPGGGALRPALDRLLAIDAAQRSDTAEVRRLLTAVGGAPPASPREIHDPDIAAALAALDAATQIPSPPHPERPTPPFPPTALTTADATAPGGLVAAADSRDQADAVNPVDAGDSEDPTDRAGAADPSDLGGWPAETDSPRRRDPVDPTQPADRVDLPNRSEPTDPSNTADPTKPADPSDPAEPSDPADLAVPSDAAEQVGSSNRRDPLGVRRDAGEVADPAGVAFAAGGEAARGGTDAVRRTTGKRRWSWAAVLAVGALAIAVLVPAVWRWGDSAPAVSDPTPAVSATPTVPATAPPPAGYRLYRAPAGWSIAVPAAWPATGKGATISFRDGDRVLSVTERPDAPADPYAELLAQDKARGATIPGYDFMRVARVAYRSWPTADWEYRFGTRPVMHTVVRTTVPSLAQAYDISWTTEDRRWIVDHAVVDTAIRTFDHGD